MDPHEKTKDDEVPAKAGPAPPLPSAEHSERMPPPTRKGRSPKVKPAPNLGRASRSKTAGRTASSGSEEQATEESTENVLESEDSPPVQQIDEGPAPDAATVKASPGSGEDPGTSEGISSCQSRRDQPNLTKATRSPCSQPQASKEPLESSSGPSVAPDLPAESCAEMANESGEQIAPETSPETSQTSDSTGETAAPHPGAAETSPGAGTDPDPASGEPHVSQREDSPRPPAKSRFQKVKARPNLTQATRSARFRPQVLKTPKENVSSPAAGAESHQGPAESTEKNLSATLAPELKSSLDVESMERPSSTHVEKEGEETSNTPSGAGSDPELAPVGESNISQKEGPPPSTTRTRFQKIKPKPNLAMGSKSSRPNPKISSGNATEVLPVDPEAEPVAIACPENTASSDLKPSHEALTTKEDLKEMDVGALVQTESSAAAAGESLVQEPAAAADSVPSEERASLEKGGETSLVCQTRRREKVKPKPRLTGRSSASKTAASEVPVTGQRIVEEAEQTDSQPTSGQSQIEPPASASLPELEQKPDESSAGEQRTDVDSDQGSTLEGSGRNLPLRRRFSKVKPNLGLSARKRPAGPQPEVIELPLAGEHSQQEAPVSGSTQKTEAAQPELEWEIKSDATQPAGSGQPPCAENVQSGDAVQQPPENSPPASQRYDLCHIHSVVISQDLMSQKTIKQSLCPSSSESSDKTEPLKSSGKAPQASRGRLVKPKPNVTLGRRVQQQKESQPKGELSWI